MKGLGEGQEGGGKREGSRWSLCGRKGKGTKSFGGLWADG